MKHFGYFLCCLVLLLISFVSFAQPFITEVNEFKVQDSLHKPPAHPVLFIGSSSFTIWKTLQEDFPDHVVLNRAFGGSQLTDQIRYVNEVVFPYEPKQILVYCGENDLAYKDSVTAEMVVERFTTLFRLIREKLPSVPIVFVSIKPSPSRQLIQPKVMEANAAIKKFLKKKKHTGYIDVYKEMIDDEGKDRPELFGDDMLHMNREGYKIWIRIIGPYLL